MFEKEAEERAERKISNFIPQQWGVILIRTEQTYETVEGAPHFYLRSLAKMWKEGAEYGYNKAKIEVEDSYRESLCNAELNLASVTEQLEELEKEYASLKGLRKYELNVAKLEIEKLEKENAELKETIRLMNEQEARDIRTRFPC